MNLTLEQANKIDDIISEFFEKVDRRGRIASRLRRAMDKSAKYLRPKVNEWLEIMRSRIIRDMLKQYVKKTGAPGSYRVISDSTKREASGPLQKDRALDITTKLTDWEWIQVKGNDILKPAILTVLGNGGTEAFIIGGIEGSFDVLNPRSVAWAQKHCAKLVREVTEETRKGIRQIIRRGIKEGKAMPAIAKKIRPLVGLTSRQMMTVANHEEWLIINRPELSAKEIERRIDVYARRKHRRRADMIARTESAYAVDEGTLEGYEEAEVEKVEWLTSQAGACDECIAQSGRKFKIKEAHGMQPAHPICRCCWSPVV